MSGPVRRSLRRRMAVLAFAAVFVPVVVLLAVVLVTENEQVTGTPEGGVVEVTVDAAPSILVPLIAMVLAVPLALAVSAWAGRLLRPLTDVTAAIERVEVESLDQRLRLRSAPEEVQTLGDAFDRMLDRLAASSTAQQRLLEDTGHQLRTPLSTATLAIEVLSERYADDVGVPDPDLVQARRAIERLTATVADLLADARSRQRLVAQVDIDLTVLARRVIGDMAGAARSPDGDVEAPVGVRLTAPPQCPAAIDGRAVERALANLIDNAVRLSPPGSFVDVIVGECDGRAFVAVEDDGPGIAPDEQPVLFDRYWRTGRGDGHGIGLAIVAQVAADHGGVEVTSPAGSRSTRFTLWFER